MTIREAWRASPGPRTLREALLLAAKGFCMGAADIVPGVSGGTVAFIAGIYEDLVAALRAFDGVFFRSLLGLDPVGALGRAHLRFLLPLLTGMGVALVTMAGAMHQLLANHPVQIWAFFFGLILASISMVGRQAGDASLPRVLLFLGGAAASWIIIGLAPARTPDEMWFLFLCGALAICAMILPGISGAFILLILGKYEFVTGALKNPFASENFIVLAVFGCGCVVGIASFSRLLSWLLGHFHGATLATLAGFMLGSLRKVWPWKQVLETKMESGKLLVLRETNVLPAVDADLFAALTLMAIGFAAALALKRFAVNRGVRT